jgi:hypothetical protein
MPEWKLPIRPQWLLAAVVVAAFIPWWLYTSHGERRARETIELHTPFSRPMFEMRFSKKIYYDPQTFVGRGRKAGYWEWSPDGLALTEKGAQYFRDTGEEYATSSPIGRRAITSVRAVQKTPDGLAVTFKYTWTEVAEPAITLLPTAPRQGQEYEGTAALAEEGGVWKLKTFSTPDLEKPLAIVLYQATGARR